MNGAVLIDYDRLLDVLETEGELLASSARGAEPDLDMHWCPGMTLGETVRHVGSVYRMVVSWLRAGTRPTRWQRAPHDGQSLTDYLLAGLRELLAELSAHDPDWGCQTWWQVHSTYGFWYRRMAHETTVHRVDVQHALAGVLVGGIADDIALDGIDEVLSLWFAHRLDVLGTVGARPATVAVRAGRRHWIARATPTGTAAWRAEPAEVRTADATVSADPMGMYLWLWGRRPKGVVTPAGDWRAIEQLWSLLRIATR